jgi:hypothetical protein
MQQTNESQLRAVLLAALADSGKSNREVAIQVAAAHADLCAAWMLDRLSGLVRSLRSKSPDPEQMAFPFHSLSVQIPVKTGKVPLGPATIGILRQSEKVLLKRLRSAKPRSNSTLGRIQREIALMEPWAFRNRRITVQRVRELIAGGEQPPPIPKRSKMSEAMRRYWDSKNPEERSAIARRRRAKARRTRVSHD